MREGLPVTGLLIAAVVVFGSGFALHRLGRPYGTALLNLHKLVDLAAVVIVAVMVYRANGATPLSSATWAAAGLAVALFVALFASGAVVSASKSPPVWVLRAHRLVPWPGLVAAGLTVYLVAGA